MKELLRILSTPVYEGLELLRYVDTREAIVLTDANCESFCLPLLVRNNPDLADRPRIVLEPGVKDLDGVQRIWSELVALRATRETCLICLGGGTTGDLGGFAASVYKRGIPFVNVPTTLLAMSDSCVGGKTAADHAGVRNVIGTHWEPAAVFIETRYLGSLTPEALADGMSEIVKHAILSGGALWEWAMSSTSTPDYDWLIGESLAVKKAFVEQDPRDAGIRQALNFGHTVAHAIEAVTDISHGQAVALGLLSESWLSVSKVGLPSKEYEQIEEAVLRRCRLPDSHEIQTDRLESHHAITALSNDKKNANDRIQLSLIAGVGDPRIKIPCSTNDIWTAIKRTIELCPAE